MRGGSQTGQETSETQLGNLKQAYRQLIKTTFSGGKTD